MERAYHLVVWGATGFTGRLVCEHIAKDYQGKIKWAIAGRSKEKLEAVKADLTKINPACQEVPVLLADSMDQESINHVAAATQVLVTTAGPYAKIGLPVVKACAQSGTHYCDLTGEPNFILRTIHDLDGPAKQSGAKIVHSCGYDSVPSDLTTLQAVHFAKERFGRPPDEVTLLQSGTGGASGGTIDSALYMMSEDPAVLKYTKYPYCLDPSSSPYHVEFGPSGGAVQPPKKRGPDTPPRIGALWTDATRMWTAPFIMAAVNEPTVRRSNALLGFPYGDNFRFCERIAASSYLAAAAMSAGYIALGAGILAAHKLPFVRKLLPASGEGPSKKVQTSSYWKAEAHALLRQQGDAPEKRVVAVLQDQHRDPGYWSTSRMLLETALCLALDTEKLQKDPYASKCPAGILTPAAACGLVLLERLQQAGYTLQSKEV